MVFMREISNKTSYRTNSDLVRRSRAALIELTDRATVALFSQVTVVSWVPGHCGILGNNRRTLLA